MCEILFFNKYFSYVSYLLVRYFLIKLQPNVHPKGPIVRISRLCLTTALYGRFCRWNNSKKCVCFQKNVYALSKKGVTLQKSDSLPSPLYLIWWRRNRKFKDRKSPPLPLDSRPLPRGKVYQLFTAPPKKMKASPERPYGPKRKQRTQ